VGWGGLDEAEGGTGTVRVWGKSGSVLGSSEVDGNDSPVKIIL
jgi:hypothetical protein